MTERWVLNASPLIALARIGQEALLRQLSHEVIVPQAVAEEIEAGPSQDRARQALLNGGFRIVRTSVLPDILSWDLGKGESAVLSFAVTAQVEIHNM